jgi:hypothetical protein
VPRRSDIDLDGRAVRVQAAYSARYSGKLVLGPPKSSAGRPIVGIPNAIFPVLRHHLGGFAKPGADGLVFPGLKGSPLRRARSWPSVGNPGLERSRKVVPTC